MAAADTVTVLALSVHHVVLRVPAPSLASVRSLLSFAESVDCARDMAASDTVTDRPLPVLNEVLTWPAPAPAPPAPALEVEPRLLSFAESVDGARDMAASDAVTDRPLPVLNEVLTWPAPAPAPPAPALEEIGRAHV